MKKPTRCRLDFPRRPDYNGGQKNGRSTNEKVYRSGNRTIIAVFAGMLRNLTLEMGIGALEFGIGTSYLTLLGSKDDYRVAVTKGLGSVCLDGQDILDFGSAGNGENHIEIAGGVGDVHISFRTP